MNTKQPASICILLLSILFLNGCSESANDSANLPTQPEATIASDDHPTSDVKLTLPDIESSTTLALRAEGKFNPAAHDFGNPFEFEFQGRMHYRIRLTCKPFVNDEWTINPLADITNETDSTKYVAYYAAFFNKEGRIVGCCNQSTSVKPSERPMQLGSLVIRAPKETLQTATHYKIVAYESNERIGVAPISPDAATSMIGRSGNVIAQLEQLDSTVTPGDQYAELRILTKVVLEVQVERNRSTHLKVTSAEEYDLSLTARMREQSTTNGKGEVLEQFAAWETAIELERTKRTKGIRPIGHAALLDAQGQLIMCATDMFVPVAVPEDALLSADKLDLVVYETVATTP